MFEIGNGQLDRLDGMIAAMRAQKQRMVRKTAAPASNVPARRPPCRIEGDWRTYMSVYQFTLIVEGPDLQGDNAIDALFEAGCGDALVGRTDGIQYLDFDREAPNPQTAILSATADVERLPDVEVMRLAGGGLVAVADCSQFREAR